jgi:hypothetical protein
MFESGNFIIKLRKEPIQNPIRSVTYAPGNRQHNSRTTKRSAFKFPDEKTDSDESEYDADYFWKHKNTMLKKSVNQ